MAKNAETEYLEWERKKHSKWSAISKKIQSTHVIGILIMISLGNYWVTTGKIDTNLFWGILVAMGFFVLFLMYREDSEAKLIPEHIIKQIGQESLEKKRALGIEIPFDCKVKVTLVGEGIWEQDMVSGTSGMIRRDVGFEVIRKGYIKKGVIGIQPYNGTILGLRWERFGYTGKESKDRIIVPVEVIKRKEST